MNSLHRYIALVLGILFVLFAVFQYNDPDPIQWMLVYGFAAAVSFGIYMKQSNRILLIISVIGFIIGAVVFWPESWHGVTLDDKFATQVEHARESLGLGICAVTMLYYFFISKK